MKEPNNTPIRMCVSCKTRNTKENLFKIVKNEDKYIVDKNHKEQARSFYVCKDLKCIEKLSKHKRYTVGYDVLISLVDEIRKQKNSLKDILQMMRASKCVVFGNEIVIDNLNKNKLKLAILANDIKENIKDKLVRRLDEKGISFFYFLTKEELGEVFNKSEINVIGITDEKTKQGILKQVGGELHESARISEKIREK